MWNCLLPASQSALINSSHVLLLLGLLAGLTGKVRKLQKRIRCSFVASLSFSSLTATTHPVSQANTQYNNVSLEEEVEVVLLVVAVAGENENTKFWEQVEEVGGGNATMASQSSAREEENVVNFVTYPRWSNSSFYSRVQWVQWETSQCSPLLLFTCSFVYLPLYLNFPLSISPPLISFPPWELN